MSAKKRGPGRPPKNKAKAKVRKPAPTAVHTVPSHFWGQVGAILLGLVTVMLALGLFGVGGSLPLELATAVRWLLGWTAFVIPVVFAIQIIQVFKQPEDRIPVAIWVATILFLSIFAGLFQLFIVDPKSLTLAQEGNGGGTVGWAVADFALSFVNVPLAAVIFIALLMVLVMFIFSISPKALIDATADFFGREVKEAEPATIDAGDDKVKINGVGKEGEISVNRSEDELSPREARRRAREEAKRQREEERESTKQAKANPTESSSDSFEVKKPTIKPAVEGEVVTPPVKINNSNWELPSINLLSKNEKAADPGNIKLRVQQIESTLTEFGIGGKIKSVNVGPRVTQYCLDPQRGVPLNKITSRSAELSKNLAVSSIRIEAPIPGQHYVGIEIPDKTPAMVSIRSILESREWTTNSKPLTFAVGQDITGKPIVLNLAKLPHLLIAGTTGSGKSVMENVIILSLLYRNSPDTLKLVLIDPKGNELAPYNDIPHLAAPIIAGTAPDEIRKLIRTLNWVTNEMDRRYKLFAERGGIKNLETFCQKFPDEKMPNIVVIVDEYTDMLDVAKAAEREAIMTALQRIAQKGRAAGIHEIILMQIVRAKYIQGQLKGNIPAGFAFAVNKNMESRQIIGESGAEQLLGHGDMLMVTQEIKLPRRIQAAFVDDDDLAKVITQIKLQSGPQYNEDLMVQLSDDSPDNGGTAVGNVGGGNPEYKKAVEVVVSQGKASTSLLIRRMGIGYGKAARIMDELEENGVVGPPNGSKSREVLISSVDEAD